MIDGVQWLIAIPFGIGSFIMGGLAGDDRRFRYPSYVYHHRPRPAKRIRPDVPRLPLASGRNVAQGGAALAVAIKTRNKKTQIHGPARVAVGVRGITEPAIFGVNLRFFRSVHRRCSWRRVRRALRFDCRAGCDGYGRNGHLWHPSAPAPSDPIYPDRRHSGGRCGLRFPRIMGTPEEASQPQPYPAAGAGSGTAGGRAAGQDGNGGRAADRRGGPAFQNRRSGVCS